LSHRPNAASFPEEVANAQRVLPVRVPLLSSFSTMLAALDNTASSWSSVIDVPTALAARYFLNAAVFIWYFVL
jgi:hypothetical protein